ncbi:ankyrin repeat-containing domain protein, partial [Mycena epipterygia]
MTDRPSKCVKEWFRVKLHQTVTARVHSASIAPETEGRVLPLALELVEQIAELAQTVPFIGPVAALMSGVLVACKEVKDTNGDNSLFAHIIDLTGDLCAVILRLEAKNRVELIGCLKRDLETYAGLLERSSVLIQEYAKQPADDRLAINLVALDQEFKLFEARFRNNRLVDVALNEREHMAVTKNLVHQLPRKHLEEWSNPPDMIIKQSEIQKLRKEGTGSWFLNSAQFIEWQNHPGCLWILGPSGAGKSVLSSALINKLVADKELFDPEKAPAVAFFYFDIKDRGGQTVESALRRIILQLSAQSSDRLLGEEYLVSMGHTLPTYQRLQKNLEALLLEIGRTYIFLDALDECKDSEYQRLVDFISTLRRWTATPLHLLITSQPRRIFSEHFQDMPCTELDPDVMQEDLTLFVHNELGSVDIWASHADHITARIVNKSNGTFRLAACLLVELSRYQYQGDSELIEFLENFPNDLFGMYDRLLRPIRQEDLIYVGGVLRWLVFSREPPTLDQLADAVSFDFSDPAHFTYTPDWRPDSGRVILKWLEGLVVVNDDSESGRSQVVLAHSSVQDYVLSPHFTTTFGYDLSASLSQTFIAQTCISYLSNDRSLINTHPSPLAVYAMKYWCQHLLQGHDHSALFSGAMALLQLYEGIGVLSSPLHFCCREGYIDGVRGFLTTGADVNAEAGSALRVASAGGHTEIVRLLLDASADMNAADQENGTALQAASGGGWTEVVRVLLDAGADVNALAGEYGSSLQIASSRGHRDIVRNLLENGADVNAVVRERSARGPGLQRGRRTTSIYALKFGSALWVASSMGHREIVRMLLEHGADVNGRGGGGHSSALNAASRGGHTEIVQMLLENGANIDPTDFSDRSALIDACAEGHTEIVLMLLRNGVNVNATGGEYGSALRAASAKGRTEIVSILLESGANINHGEYGTALHDASAGGHTEIVYMLLANGANVAATHRDYGTALHAASGRGHIEIVHILLENGADVDATGDIATQAPRIVIRIPGFDNVEVSRYGSALSVACAGGHITIVEMLLDNGADVNARGGGKYGSALQAASIGGHKDIVRLLLEKGAEINAMGRKHGNGFTLPGSALQDASEKGHVEIVLMLLQNGANVHSRGGEYGCALHAASTRGHPEIVSILLENGADINTPPGIYGSPLYAATSGGHKAVVEILLESGADVNGTNGRYGCALQTASRGGRKQIVDILLEHGADVNGRDGQHGSALNAASAGGHIDIVRTLLENGADINGPGGNHGSVFHTAAAGGHTEIVSLLLENGADINGPGGNHGSVFHTAAAGGHTEIVSLLLENGADVNAKGGPHG